LISNPCENDTTHKVTFSPSTIIFEDTTLRPLNNIPGPVIIESILTFSGLNDVLSSYASITAQIWLTHPANGNCEIRLYGPDGSYIILSDKRGGNNANIFNDTLFSDLASNSISNYTFSDNLVASYLQPEQPLSDFRGKNPNGKWKLWINDTVGESNGMLNKVKLEIQGKAIKKQIIK